MGQIDIVACAFCSTPPVLSSGLLFAPNLRGCHTRVRQRPRPTQTCSCFQQQQQRLTTSIIMQAVAPSTQRRRTEAAGVHSINSRGLSPIRRNEVGVGVAAPLPRSSDGHITAITAQKEIVAARNRRKWTEVLEVLDRWESQAEKLNAKTYNIALSALSKFGRWQEATAILDRMSLNGVPPDVYSINGAISACGRAGKWQRALDLLAKMEQEGSGIRPDIFSYNSAINALAKAQPGRWRQALGLLSKMNERGLTPDVCTYTSAMCACDRAGEWQRALDVMDTMRERNIVPNVVSYGTAISACARSGQWQKALSLLAEMPSRGLTPNAVTYGSAVHACVVGEEPQQALALLDEMMERGIAPDAAAFTAGMRAVGGWAPALRLLEAMKRHGTMPDLVAYNVALSVIARSGRDDVALAMLERMRKDGLSPDLVSFNTAIDACAVSENWHEAVRLLEEDMVDAKIQPDVVTLTSVIHACSGPGGNWEKAYKLLDQMYQNESSALPNKSTYDLVIQACGYGGEWELAVSLLDDMADVGIALDTQTFNMAIAACARSGQWLAAHTLAATMPNRGVAPDGFTYTSVVAACGRTGKWERAKQVFDEARYVHRLIPTLHIYGALLSCLADCQQWSDVLLYLDRMAADGVAPDSAAIATGVLAAAQLGYGRRALSLLDGEKWIGGGGNTDPLHGNSEEEDPVSDRKLPRGISACQKGAGGKWDGVETVEEGKWDKEEGIKSTTLATGGWEALTPTLLTTLLHALEHEKEDAIVLGTVRRAREAGVVLNSRIYRCALKACGNLGDCSQANHLLSQMQEENLMPNIMHWNHALRTTTACAHWRQAHSHLRAMHAAGVTPDEFSYMMALKACSAGLWSGNSWDEIDGCGTQDRDTSAVAQPLDILGYMGESPGANIPPCRGRHALELLDEMKAFGIQLCERSLALAMAACLESHRDSHIGDRRSGPSENEHQLSEEALSLFDRLLETGVTPSSTTFALALKACARTANTSRASSLLLFMLDTHRAQASEPSFSPSLWGAVQPHDGLPTLEVRPGHLASAIAAFDAAGDWGGAVGLWEEVLSRGVAPRSPGYAAIIAAAARAGDLTAAFRLKDEAQTKRQALLAPAFRLLMATCEARGENERAAQLYDDARSGRLVIQESRS